jgi:hypothetical protein
VTDSAWGQIVARYADRLHRSVGERHHVASPLGAWIVIALCSTLAEGACRDELSDVLGADPNLAAEFAGVLTADPHPLVGYGAAVWNRPAFGTPGIGSWKAGLPTEIETGDIPAQATLDSWSERHTLGLIPAFPDVDPAVVLLMATALATKVSWSQPFGIAPGSSLGPASPWSTQLRRVLCAPVADRRHQQFIADGDRAGPIAVHMVKAEGGLAVCSVIAAPDVDAMDVLADAHDIALAEASMSRSVLRRSLFDLPLGEGPFWTISEEQVQTVAAEGREERFQTLLPAWSVESKLDLSRESLGYPAAASVLKDALGLSAYQYEASQSTVARYSRVGFEAAALTSLVVATSRPTVRSGVRRTAELRFGHPFAAVAVVTADGWPAVNARIGSPWHGLPIFSGWIIDPDDAEDETGLRE